MLKKLTPAICTSLLSTQAEYDPPKIPLLTFSLALGLSSITVLWGIVVVAMGFVTNYQELVGCRVVSFPFFSKNIQSAFKYATRRKLTCSPISSFAIGSWYR